MENGERNKDSPIDRETIRYMRLLHLPGGWVGPTQAPAQDKLSTPGQSQSRGRKKRKQKEGNPSREKRRIKEEK